jgi:hypothetical protein
MGPGEIRTQTHATEQNQFEQISRLSIVSRSQRPCPLKVRRTVGADKIFRTPRTDYH